MPAFAVELGGEGSSSVSFPSHFIFFILIIRLFLFYFLWWEIEGRDLEVGGRGEGEKVAEWDCWIKI